MKNLNIFRNIMISLAFVFVLLFGLSTASVGAEAQYDPLAQAQDACSGAASSNPACTASSEDPITGPDGIIMKIANLIAFAAGTIAVIMIIFAGFRLVKSGGDSSKVTVARETIIYALVGLVVIVAARLIVGIVISNV